MKIFRKIFDSSLGTFGRFFAYFVIGLLLSFAFHSCSAEAKTYDVKCSSGTCSRFSGSNLTSSFKNQTLSSVSMFASKNTFNAIRGSNDFWLNLNVTDSSFVYDKSYNVSFDFFYSSLLTLSFFNLNNTSCNIKNNGVVKVNDDNSLNFTAASISCDDVVFVYNNVKVIRIDAIFSTDSYTATGILGVSSQFNISQTSSSSSQDIIDNQNANHDEAEKTRKGIWNTLTDLPRVIVEKFTSMLTDLFVPNETQLNDIISQSRELSSNFGFIGQSVDFLLGIFQSILTVPRSQGCVSLPELNLQFSKLNLGIDDWRVWNTQNVCLSDNAIFGNENFMNTIRLVSTAGLVILFVNYCIHYDKKVLSKNDDVQGGDGN